MSVAALATTGIGRRILEREAGCRRQRADEPCTIAEFRVGAPRLARRAPRRARAAPTPARNARRADGADAAREVDPVRRGLDAVGLARARRRPRRLADAAHRARRGARRPATSPTPASSRSSRCSRRRSSTSRRRRSRPRSSRGCSRARRCGARGSRSRAPAATSPSLSCRAVPDGAAAAASSVGHQRPEGVDEPRAVRPIAACCCTRTGTDRTRATAASPRSSSTWTRPGITVAPIEMINGVPEFAEVFFDDVVVPADRMLGERERRLGRRDEHPPVRALVVLLAAHRVPLPPPRSCSSRSCRDDERSAEVVGDAFLQLTRSAPAPAPPSTAWPTGATLGAETSIDKVLVATAEQTLYDAVRRLLPGVVELDDSRGGRDRGAPSTCTRVPRRSTAARPRCSATSSPGDCSTSAATD